MISMHVSMRRCGNGLLRSWITFFPYIQWYKQIKYCRKYIEAVKPIYEDSLLDQQNVVLTHKLQYGKQPSKCDLDRQVVYIDW